MKSRIMILFVGLSLTVVMGSVQAIPRSGENDTTEYNGHEYQLFPFLMTWAKAKADCEARGGHLVTIASAQENDFVNSLGGSEFWKRSEVWIGFTDEITEGVWQWITGENVTYIRWGLGQPNDLGGEDYAEMLMDGSWNDGGPPGTPNEKHFYVCEWEEKNYNNRDDITPPLNVIFGGGLLIGIGVLFLGQWYRTRKIKRH